MEQKHNNLGQVLQKGLKLMFSRLVEKAIKEDRELVVTDEKGNPIRIKASELKARLENK